jgi:hypothetical protein
MKPHLNQDQASRQASDQAAQTPRRQSRAPAAKFKLPSLSAFANMTERERAHTFLAWTKTQKGDYDYWDEQQCALARFGRALAPKQFRQAGGREIFLKSRETLALDEGYAVCAGGRIPPSELHLRGPCQAPDHASRPLTMGFLRTITL